MTQRDAKETAIFALQRAKRLRLKVGRLIDEAEEMERIEASVPSLNLQAKRQELREQADYYEHERLFTYHEIERFIDMGNEREARRGHILHQKDVECKTFEQIAVDMSYTFDYVRHEYYAGLIDYGRWLNGEKQKHNTEKPPM